MSCKLHIPIVYNPRKDEARCVCGSYVITRAESAHTGRWRSMFGHVRSLRSVGIVRPMSSTQKFFSFFRRQWQPRRETV